MTDVKSWFDTVKKIDFFRYYLLRPDQRYWASIPELEKFVRILTEEFEE